VARVPGSSLGGQITRPALKPEKDLIEADDPHLQSAPPDAPQNSSGTVPVAVEVKAELRARLSVTLSMGLDAAPKIDSAGAPGLAPAPPQTSETSVFVARTPLTGEAQRSNNALIAGGSHPLLLATPLEGQARAAQTRENLPGELAFAARLVERIESGDDGQPAARSGGVAVADGAAINRPERPSLEDLSAIALPRALPSRAGNFQQSEPGPVTSLDGVREALDARPHAAMKSATLSDDPARDRTGLDAGEKVRVEAGAREALSTASEPSAGKPAGPSAISALEPAHIAALDRNPERGGTPPASATETSLSAAAEKSEAAGESAAQARDISLRLAPDQKANVEVRLIDRGGEVRVAVRSADPVLAESMRAGLSDLAERLSERGFKTDIWRPEPAGTSAGFLSGPGPESYRHEDSGQHSGSDQHDGRNPNHQRHPGQQPGQQHQQQRPQWVEELEHTLSLTSPLKRSQKA
jgi:hypothetical protein